MAAGSHTVDTLTRALRRHWNRTRHLTDRAAVAVAAGGLLVGLGWRACASVILQTAALWFITPAVLAVVRDLPVSRATPARRAFFWILTMDAPHAGALFWLAWTAFREMGAANALLLAGAVLSVYAGPRLALPAFVRDALGASEPRPRAILLQRSDVLGDFVLATVALRVIHATDPATRVAWLTRASNLELMDGHPFAPSVIEDPTVEGASVRQGHRRARWPTLARRIAPWTFDALINLWDRATWTYHLAAWRAGIPVRAGNRAARGGWLLNAGPDRADDPTRHEAERNLDILTSLGFTCADIPHLWIGRSQAYDDRAVELLRRRGLAPGQTFVTLSPGTSGTNRRLDAHTYAAVVDHVTERHGAVTVLLGTAADAPLCGEILTRCSVSPIDLSGQTTSGVLAAVIARSRLHIGCDSGPAHVAAAVGVPGVVISPAKSQRPLVWGPWMTAHRIVRPRARCTRTCHATTCTADACVTATTPQLVCDAVDALWRGDGVVAPRDGRAYWLTRSASPILHTSDGTDSTGRTRDTLRLVRDAGFIEYALACPPQSALARAAAAEGFDVRPNDTASLVNVIVEFDGGPVCDLDATPRVAVGLALALSRRGCTGMRPARIAVPPGVVAPEILIDVVLAGLRPGNGRDPSDILPTR